MRIEQSIEIDAAPEAVWAVMADVERWPEWSESMTSVQRLDDGPFAIGSRARIRQPRLPAVTWTVTALEPTRSFTWEAGSPGVRTVATHEIEPADGGGSLVRLSVDSRGLIAALTSPLMSKLTARYVDMEARGLKQRAEATATGSP